MKTFPIGSISTEAGTGRYVLLLKHCRGFIACGLTFKVKPEQSVVDQALKLWNENVSINEIAKSLNVEFNLYC